MKRQDPNVVERSRKLGERVEQKSETVYTKSSVDMD